MHNIDIKDIYQVRWCPKCGTLYDTCSNQRDYFETPQNLVKPVDRITADRDRWKERCESMLTEVRSIIDDLYSSPEDDIYWDAKTHDRILDFVKQKISEHFRKEAGDE
jgi:hypothetical protein